MRKKSSGFYADSLEMLLDTMCNVLGGVVFITLTLAQLVQVSPASAPAPSAAELTKDMAVLSATNAAVVAELQQLEAKLHAAHEARTNVMSLPNAKVTNRKPWPVIVRYGRLYPLNVLPGDGTGAPARNLQSLAWRGRTVEPNPDLGDDAEAGVEAMIQRFRQTSRTNVYFAFEVYADSFAEFNRAKETVVKLGFQYGWEPLPANRVLEVGAGGAHMPAQN